MMQWMVMGAMLAGAVDPQAFRAAVEEAAGQPVRLDPRIAVPACAGGLALARRPTAVDVLCPATGWRLVVPVATAGQGGAAERLVRRGSAVVVEAAGPGYAVRVDGVAEADAGAGALVRVRNARSGQRFLARVADDGRLVMAGR